MKYKKIEDVRGVFYESGQPRKKPWRARPVRNGQKVELGYYSTREQGQEAVWFHDLKSSNKADELPNEKPWTAG